MAQGTLQRRAVGLVARGVAQHALLGTGSSAPGGLLEHSHVRTEEDQASVHGLEL